jgi:hypothetical protein
MVFLRWALNKLIDEIIFLLFASGNFCIFTVCMWGNSTCAHRAAHTFYTDHIRAKSITHTHTVSTLSLYANAAIAVII